MSRAIGVATLVLANLVPIVGVLTHHMTFGDVLVAYWLENVVIGVMTLVRILSAGGGLGLQVAGKPGATGTAVVLWQLFLAGFFCFHYGMFTVVHGVFTFLLAAATGVDGAFGAWVLFAVAVLASHLVSLCLNWFGRGEREFITVQQAMFAPYPRIIVLHLSILGGGFLLAFGISPDSGEDPFSGSLHGRELLTVVGFCVLKVAIDVGLHLRERHRFARRVTGPTAAAGMPGSRAALGEE